jgi:Ni2+-binding GTPase involved in maturation of urease and hydrogenase
MIINGPYGSGKTQLLLNLIMDWMKWDKLYLVAPNVDDRHCYQVLKDYNECAAKITGGCWRGISLIMHHP